MPHILIVEDEAAIADTLIFALQGEGFTTTWLSLGAAALEHQRQTPADLIILDIGLPDLDGYHVARALRSQPESAGALLIALTGYGQESDRQRTRAAGFDHHLVKPASLEDVERVIATDGENGQPRNPGVELRTDATG